MPAAAAATAAPAGQPPAAGTCRRFTTCVPENPCHTGWVTGCRANVPICTDIGGWLSNGTTCGNDQVCYMGECLPCAAGDACQLKDQYGYDVLCRAGAIACDTGQPVCTDTGPARNGDGCWPGSEPYYVCTDGSCSYCPFGSSCTPPDAPCHQGRWSCADGPRCEDTDAFAPDGSWCGGYDRVCHGGECVTCQGGAPCDPPGLPCWTGYTDCSSGTPVCQPSSYKQEGTSCGGELVCNGSGSCVAPCVGGQTCTPDWNSCRTGTTVCYGATSTYCMETGSVQDGTPCGSSMTCVSGYCSACGAGTWCSSMNPCYPAGTISCATGQCDPAGTPYPDGTRCGVGAETCAEGVCTGVPGSALVVRSVYGSADLTGTSWTSCYPDDPGPGQSRRRTDSYQLGGATIVTETFATPDCSGEPTDRVELGGAATTAGDRTVTWSSAYAPDGLWSPITATAIAISAADPATGAPLEVKDLRFVSEWNYPRREYLGDKDSPPAPDGWPTQLTDKPRTEVLPCNEGELCANPYGTCDEWAISCAAGYPACNPTGRTLPDGSWCSGGSCQAGVCAAGTGVSGSRAITYWPDAGPTAPVPTGDLWNFGAYWPDAGGGFYSGWSSGDGTFTVPGVPDGPYVLTFSRGVTYFIETDARWVDLGEDLIGRQGSQRAYGATSVTISLDGLAPWQSTDSVQLVCGNVGLAATPFLGTAFTPGATSASGTFDWIYQPELDGSQEVATLFQSSSATIPGTSLGYRSAVKWGQAPPTTISSGGTGLSLSAALADVPAVVPFSTSWPTTAYAAHVAEVNPAATLGLQRLAVLAKPWSIPAVAAGYLPYFNPNAAQLLTVRAPTTPGDVSIQDVSFGRFLPEHWIEYRDVRLNATVPVDLPDGTQRTYNGFIVRTEELATAPASADPLVTPPLEPRVQVAGELVSAFVPRTGVGTGPLLAWSPPATGAPTSYTVTLLSPMESSTSFLVVAMAITSHTSFRFPEGLLDPNSTYLAVITARSAERERLDAPLRMQFDADWAQTVTAGFKP